MSRAAITSAAPLPPVGGGAPRFSAKLGAWIRKPSSAERSQQGFVQAALRRRAGNLTLSQRGKLWLGVTVWCAICLGGFAWAMISLYQGAGR